LREGLTGQKAFRAQKTDRQAFVAIIVSVPQATQIDTIEFCSQKLCLDRNEGCCAAFLEQKLRAPSFPATSQCELKSEIYQTFACVPFLILDPVASWTINKETVDCGRLTLPFFSSAYGFRSGLGREGPAADLPQQLGFGRVFWEWRPGLRPKRTSFCKQPKVLQWFFGSVGFQFEHFQL
jgi:hypothetical protein